MLGTFVNVDVRSDDRGRTQTFTCAASRITSDKLNPQSHITFNLHLYSAEICEVAGCLQVYHATFFFPNVHLYALC